jgi:hypothetical protein
MRHLQLSVRLASTLAGFVAAYRRYMASKEYDAPYWSAPSDASRHLGIPGSQRLCGSAA